MNEKQERAKRANALLQTISEHGRRFFHHDGRVARFEVDERGRVWFIDAYSQKRIYTHYTGRWRGFTLGGTMRWLIESLRDYIRTGKVIVGHFGPWPDEICRGDLWGYGDDMRAIRKKAVELAIAAMAETEVSR